MGPQTQLFFFGLNQTYIDRSRPSINDYIRFLIESDKDPPSDVKAMNVIHLPLASESKLFYQNRLGLQPCGAMQQWINI